jgi:hypothetical protein
MSNYEPIQPILDDWAQAHGLQLFTQHQDEEVRATHIVDDKGAIYEVWILPPNEAGMVTIGAALYQKRGSAIRNDCAVADLRRALEKTYKQVTTWIAESGNTRPPIR